MTTATSERTIFAPAGQAAPAALPAELRRPPLEADGGEPRADQLLHAAIGRSFAGFSPMGLAEAWYDWALHMAVSPGRITELARQGLKEVVRLGELAASTNASVCAPCERSLPQDKRFRHPSWQKWPYALYAESLLAAERLWDEATRDVHGATAHHLAQLNFVGRQTLDLLAPSNWPWSNPEVVEATVREHGFNLLRGAAFALEDAAHLARHEGPPEVRRFRPGKDVALTPGKVVHRTPLAEIIQYSPSTETVQAEPVLIVPAWIMKYYILDLRPENSLIRHLVDQGFTVFVVSWKNPGIEDRDLALDDYRRAGVLPAIAAALAATGASRLHAVGYCIGGTLLALTAAAMARDLDGRLASLTFLAAQVDFREAGELRLFIDESQLAILDDIMAEDGVLEAARMAGTFHLLRSNDLIWSRMVRTYLLGKREEMTDIAAWSADATRMPARMHSEYLRAFYLNNDLAEGRFRVEGEPVSLRDIHIPIFAVGTEHDHVAPWRSVYKLHRLADADVTFVLADAGHNRGIVAPPSQADRHFNIGTMLAHDRHVTAEQWLAGATLRKGSWWPAWFGWLAGQSSGTVPARDVADRGLGAAPGRYVHG
ncbi:alpha/beta fold hydrolase [Bosea sp. CS1GBMeth4]|uniref:PHA/PHB synthase family protein n=1 Tax=Bosea sp. CS1GBMeth4 TaxID=1892849 RepID=UPI0016474556|nr:alpha/beta fold hydrolase [Bosea sp. CS1GBMeth4]